MDPLAWSYPLSSWLPSCIPLALARVCAWTVSRPYSKVFCWNHCHIDWCGISYPSLIIVKFGASINFAPWSASANFAPWSVLSYVDEIRTCDQQTIYNNHIYLWPWNDHVLSVNCQYKHVYQPLQSLLPQYIYSIQIIATVYLTTV